MALVAVVFEVKMALEKVDSLTATQKNTDSQRL